MGYLFLVFAYTLYGMSDAVGLLSYAMGSNAYNLAFLNSALPLPIIVGIMCLTKQNIRIGKRTLFVAVFLGALSATATLTMNLSYVMIGVGMGTMLHMSHTLVTTFGEAAILKRRPKAVTVFSVMFVLTGIFCMVGGQSEISVLGIFLALVSGAAYGGLLLIIGHTSVRSLSLMQVQFYTLATAALAMLLFGQCAHRITLAHLPAAAWVIHGFCALGANFAAFLFVQLGVRRASAAAGSIIGSLEPVTSAVLGVFLLHETMTFLKLLGCVLIVVGISIEPFCSLRNQSRDRIG